MIVVEHYVSPICFVQDRKYYLQTEETAMGFPFPPLLANILMTAFEEEAIITSHMKSNVCCRYVYDVSVIWLDGPTSTRLPYSPSSGHRNI